MAQITGGLDIGTTSIRCLRVARGVRGTSLVNFFSQPIPSYPGQSLLECQAAALRELKAAGRLKGDRWVVSVPTHSVSIREIELPFLDPQKIDQVAPFEIEGSIPFDLSQVIVDATVLERSAEGQSCRILVASLSRQFLSERLSLLKQVGIDPQEVELEGMALARLYRDSSRQGFLWLLEIGARKSILCLLRGDRVVSLRGIPIGGEEFTAFLAVRLSRTIEEAEKIKQEIDLADAGDRRSMFLKEALEPWMAEIEKSLRLSSRPGSSLEEGSGESEEAPKIVLLGGGARIPGLPEYLGYRLGIRKAEEGIQWDRLPETRHLSGIQELLISSEGTSYQVALGLALRQTGIGDIGFRKGDFVFGKGEQERRAHWLTVGLILAVIVGLFLGNVYVRYRIKASRYQALKAELLERFAKSFPQIRSVTQEVDQARSAIAGLKRTELFLGTGDPTPLALLNEITLAIPKEIPIEVQDLLIDSGKVRIEAQTDSFESIDRIKASLAKGGLFQEVTVSDAKVGADPTKVFFRIQLKAKGGGG